LYFAPLLAVHGSMELEPLAPCLAVDLVAARVVAGAAAGGACRIVPSGTCLRGMPMASSGMD